MSEIELKARELLGKYAEEAGYPNIAKAYRDGMFVLHPSQLAVVAALSPEWKTIDSAPKDGGEFLGWDGFDIRMTHWHKPISCEGGWYEDQDQYEIFFWAPTHWMPLPAPPEVEK